jgi:hypothetical protein
MSRQDNIVHAAHDYVRAAENLQQMKSFDLDNCGKLQVGWDFGSSTNGYRELAIGIAALVSERWQQLRDEAIANASAKLKEAEENLRKALELQT